MTSGKKVSKKEVLGRFKKVHGDEYDYSFVEPTLITLQKLRWRCTNRRDMGFLNKPQILIREVLDVHFVEK